MRIEKSVEKAIQEWESGDNESAMLHACNAVDGTARKTFPRLGNKARFTRFLRENYRILGPMGIPGINLEKTRFPVTVRGPTTADGLPDIADVIYGIHRCTHAHGDELPDGFELLADASGPAQRTRANFERGKVRLSDRIIFALVATAVFAPVNSALHTVGPHYLTYGGIGPFPIGEWWGRADDFMVIIGKSKLPDVTVDFSTWIETPS